MKILYISYFFPPFASIGGSRSFGQYTQLKKLGYDVKAISSNNQGLSIDKTYYKDSEDIIYFGKVDNGQINLSRHDSISNLIKAYILKLPKSFIRFFYLARYLLFGLHEKREWFDSVLNGIDKRLGEWVPDLIISTYSPIDTHILANRLQTKYKSRWFAEFRDCFSFNTMAFSRKENELLNLFLRKKEKDIIKNADLIISATKFIQSYYTRHHRKNSILVYGGWDESNQLHSNLERSNIRNNRRLKILHAGSMLYGTRNIDVLISAFKDFPLLRDKIEIHLVGRHTDLFRSQVLKHNLNNSILLQEEIGSTKLDQLYKQSDILLIIMKDDPMERYTVTGKIFTYIKYKKPIIIIDKFNSEASQIISEHKLGYTVKQASDLYKVLQDDLRDYNVPSEQVINRFSREKQFKSVINFIEKIQTDTTLKL